MLTRRGFLKLSTGAVITTATMAQAGALAEFMDWLRRKPAWSIPASPTFGESFVIDEFTNFRIMAMQGGYPTLLRLETYPDPPADLFGMATVPAENSAALDTCGFFQSGMASFEVDRLGRKRLHEKRIVEAQVVPSLAERFQVGDIVSITELRNLPLPTENARQFDQEIRTAQHRAWEKEQKRA